MNVVIAIPIDKTLADFIGKGSPEGSINIYTRKLGEGTIVGLMPASIDEKFGSLAECLLLSSQVVISTREINSAFGEVLIGAALLGKRIIFTDDNSVDDYVKNLKIQNFEVLGKDSLLASIISHGKESAGEDVRIDIDKAFPVKGIGSVALGVVTKGKLTVHQELYHTDGNLVMIKSIQSHDVDVNEADTGTRVGVALKGIEYDRISKGDLLTTKQVPKVTVVKVKMKLSEVNKEDVQAGGRYSIVSNFSESIVKVDSVSGDEITLKLEKQLPLAAGDECLLIRDKKPRIFAACSILSAN